MRRSSSAMIRPCAAGPWRWAIRPGAASWRRRAMRPGPSACARPCRRPRRLRRCPELVFVAAAVRRLSRRLAPDPRHLRRLHRPHRAPVAGRGLSGRDRTIAPASPRPRPTAGRDPRPHPGRRPASPPRPASPTTSSWPSWPPTSASPTASSSCRPSAAPPSSRPCRSDASTGSGRSRRPRCTRSASTPGADLRGRDLAFLTRRFGKSGAWYFGVARGEDDRPVVPDRARKSSGSETTFAEDLTSPDEIEAAVPAMADDVFGWCERAGAFGRTVTVKIKLGRLPAVDPQPVPPRAGGRARRTRRDEPGARPLALPPAPGRAARRGERLPLRGRGGERARSAGSRTATLRPASRPGLGAATPHAHRLCAVARWAPAYCALHTRSG